MSISDRFTNRRSLYAIVAPVIAALLLCWPAFVNGGAFFFPDTTAYLRGADMVVAELTGWQTEWSDKHHLYDGASSTGTPASQAEDEFGTPDHPVLLGRSVYYGLAIFPFVVLAGSFGGVLLQAALAVFALRLTFVGFGGDRRKLPTWQLISSGVLAALTPLPYVVSILMPDVFAGLAVVCAVLAMTSWDRFSTPERIGLFALLVLSALSHSSHVLLLLLLFALAIVIRMKTRAIALAGTGIVLLASLSGLAGDQLFAALVTEKLGKAPIRPPFLTARLIDDGPGHALLQERCPQIRLKACDYLDRMPHDSDIFLWSQDRGKGVFSAESLAVQRTLADQDFRFALAVLKNDPVSVFLLSVEASAKQLALIDLNIFNMPKAGQSSHGTGEILPFVIVENLPPDVQDEVRESRYFSGTMPIRFVEAASTVTVLAAMFFLAWVILAAARSRDRSEVRSAVAAGLFLFAIIANAGVTGTLSKPHDRYNIRVVWVLPLAALALLAAGRRKSTEGRNADAIQ
jgi:hypothetical protein